MAKSKVIKELANNEISMEVKDEKWYSKTFWQIAIPLAVTILGAAICAWLGLN